MLLCPLVSSADPTLGYVCVILCSLEDAQNSSRMERISLNGSAAFSSCDAATAGIRFCDPPQTDS
jgi:hypothetical protein